jgi:flavodoxin
MNVEVRYFTKTGNTKKLADAIAAALGVEAQDLSKNLAKPLDLLFLGGSMYAGGIASELEQFISTLDSALLKKVAVFSTAAIAKSAYPQLKASLQKKGITVADEEFHCKGKFLFFNAKRPNEKDCESAASFAKSLL